MDALSLIVYSIPLVVVFGFYLLRQKRVHARHATVLKQSVEAGLTEPASLHPVIDQAKCLGCGACVAACPEQVHHNVLGLINGKAQLVSPTDCIGHGMCKIVCPFDAITLVFGTAKRGVDIPVVQPNFESSVPGMFIAGELGGMGLIRNALKQGQQAIEAIAKSYKRRPGILDVVIVGAGPAGFAAALTAKSLGLSYLVLEQEALGGAVFQYPRRKLVMTQPIDLPIVGRMQFRHTTKEELLQFWTNAVKANALRINYSERVEAIERSESGFRIRTAKGEYQSTTVLLAIGRRGTPRKLGAPGEDLSKVVYSLIEPEQYRGQQVLVVGGGDSALEAAASIAEVGANTRVTLSYRGDQFQRAKPRNRDRVKDASEAGALKILLGSKVSSIATDHVVIELPESKIKVPNDAVIVNAGGILPDAFLKACGIDVVTKYGTA
jgi:thioredoxin reductase/Pyruvate/2-oxoacid:ferredoxin oxidoreductase delta subunit